MSNLPGNPDETPSTGDPEPDVFPGAEPNPAAPEEPNPTADRLTDDNGSAEPSGQDHHNPETDEDTASGGPA